MRLTSVAISVRGSHAQARFSTRQCHSGIYWLDRHNRDPTGVFHYLPVVSAESAVQAAGQVAMHARTPEQVSQAYTAAQLALDDQDVQADARQAMHISCLSPGCSDGRVSISISAKVALPGTGRAGQGLAPVSLSATRQVQLADTRGWKGAK